MNSLNKIYVTLKDESEYKPYSDLYLPVYENDVNRSNYDYSFPVLNMHDNCCMNMINTGKTSISNVYNKPNRVKMSYPEHLYNILKDEPHLIPTTYNKNDVKQFGLPLYGKGKHKRGKIEDYDSLDDYERYSPFKKFKEEYKVLHFMREPINIKKILVSESYHAYDTEDIDWNKSDTRTLNMKCRRIGDRLGLDLVEYKIGITEDRKMCCYKINTKPILNKSECKDIYIQIYKQHYFPSKKELDIIKAV